MAARRNFRNKYIITEAVADLVLNQRYPERSDDDYLECIFHSCARIAYVGSSHSRMHILSMYIKSSTALTFDQFEVNYRSNPEHADDLRTRRSMHRIPANKISTFCEMVHLAKLFERNRISRDGLALRMDDLLPGLVDYLQDYELTEFFKSDEFVYLPERMVTCTRVFEPIFVRVRPIAGLSDNNPLAEYLTDDLHDLNETYISLLPEVNPEFLDSLREERERLFNEQAGVIVEQLLSPSPLPTYTVNIAAPSVTSNFQQNKIDASKQILTDMSIVPAPTTDNSMSCTVCRDTKCNVMMECGHIICNICARQLERDNWTVKCPHCARFGLCSRLYIV